MIPAWLAALAGIRCAHHFVIRGDGDGILWLECLWCQVRTVGWIVHAPRRGAAS